MDKEYRSPIYGGIDQPGDKDGEAPKGSRVADRFTIGELAREFGRDPACFALLPEQRVAGPPARWLRARIQP